MREWAGRNEQAGASLKEELMTNVKVRLAIPDNVRVRPGPCPHCGGESLLSHYDWCPVWEWDKAQLRTLFIVCG